VLRRVALIRINYDKAEEQITALSGQLEELFRIRETEAEELLERYKVQYETQLKGAFALLLSLFRLTLLQPAQDSLIDKLTRELAQKEPLTRTGKTSVLNLITREAADEEQRTKEKEIIWWKKVAEEKESLLVQKDHQIAELERQGQPPSSPLLQLRPFDRERVDV
jgi:hypothetical protein